MSLNPRRTCLSGLHSLHCCIRYIGAAFGEDEGGKRLVGLHCTESVRVAECSCRIMPLGDDTPRFWHPPTPDPDEEKHERGELGAGPRPLHGPSAPPISR